MSEVNTMKEYADYTREAKDKIATVQVAVSETVKAKGARANDGKRLITASDGYKPTLQKP